MVISMMEGGAKKKKMKKKWAAAKSSKNIGLQIEQERCSICWPKEPYCRKTFCPVLWKYIFFHICSQQESRLERLIIDHWWSVKLVCVENDTGWRQVGSLISTNLWSQMLPVANFASSSSYLIIIVVLVLSPSPSSSPSSPSFYHRYHHRHSLILCDIIWWIWLQAGQPIIII